MGMYDTYGGVQLKVGDVCCDNFEIGQKVPIANGVYLAPDGVVVILGGRLLFVADHVFSKWGKSIKLDELLNPHNPFALVGKDMIFRQKVKGILLKMDHNNLTSTLEAAIEGVMELIDQTYVKER